MNIPPRLALTFRELNIKSWGAWSSMAGGHLVDVKFGRRDSREYHLAQARFCASQARYFYGCIAEELANG